MNATTTIEVVRVANHSSDVPISPAARFRASMSDSVSPCRCRTGSSQSGGEPSLQSNPGPCTGLASQPLMHTPLH